MILRICVNLCDSLNCDCLQSSVVYGCEITSNNTTEDSPHHISLTENTFKDRLYKHTNSFKYEIKKIAPNSQTMYGAKRKINKRYLLSGT